MNIFKKMYCRIFQFCFKVAIPMLPYYNPTILAKIDDIPEVLAKKKIKNLMLVTDKGVRSFGITQHLENILVENNINLTVYDDVVSNPTIANVEMARELYLNNKCEALIGFVDGSQLVMGCFRE